MEFEDFNLPIPNHHYSVNIEQVLKDKSVPTIIRSFLDDLRKNGYANVGQFFQSIPDLDLELLMDLANATHPDASADYNEAQVEYAYRNMLLLGMGLLMAEGSEINIETSEQGANAAIVFVTIESLARKGLVRPIRENWGVLGTNDKPVVEKLQ